MTTHHLRNIECDKHRYLAYRDLATEGYICGCPRTTRTEGLLVYKHPITGNWVVWDCAGNTWRSICGDYETARKRALMYLEEYPEHPIRCETRCAQWPQCTHDWRKWHITVDTLPEA